MITQKVDEWDENPLTNWFNKLIGMPQPVPKGNPFELTFKELPEDEYPEFVNVGMRISEEEASTPL